MPALLLAKDLREPQLRLARVVSLERELNSQAQRRRKLEDRSGAIERVRKTVGGCVRHAGNTTVD